MHCDARTADTRPAFAYLQIKSLRCQWRTCTMCVLWEQPERRWAAAAHSLRHKGSKLWPSRLPQLFKGLLLE